MSLEYIVDGDKYSVSYKELKEKYLRICSLTDSEFRKSLPEILHLVCIISYFKELQNECLVSDMGIIHLIAHQLTIPKDTEHEFYTLRIRFKELMCLA